MHGAITRSKSLPAAKREAENSNTRTRGQWHDDVIDHRKQSIHGKSMRVVYWTEKLQLYEAVNKYILNAFQLIRTYISTMQKAFIDETSRLQV